MKAILVTVEITTRVIVPDDFNVDDMRDEDYDTIRDKAYPRLIENLHTDGVGDHLTECVLDDECPFGEFKEDREQYPNDVPWNSYYDSAEASKEGWDIYHTDGSNGGEWQIQRNDEDEKFDSDISAIKYVVQKAKEGSKLHQRAIHFINENNPIEAELIKKFS